MSLSNAGRGAEVLAVAADSLHRHFMSRPTIALSGFTRFSEKAQLQPDMLRTTALSQKQGLLCTRIRLMRVRCKDLTLLPVLVALRHLVATTTRMQDQIVRQTSGCWKTFHVAAGTWDEPNCRVPDSNCERVSNLIVAAQQGWSWDPTGSLQRSKVAIHPSY